MPKDIYPKSKPTTPCAIPRVTAAPTVITMEANAFINGLFEEFKQTTTKYATLNQAHFDLEARIEMTEKTLCLIRDHLAMNIANADLSVAPRDWESLFAEVRFVGVRLVDACLSLLQERGKLTIEELLLGLNSGMYRFRTNSPLREIHAALLRQRRASKIGDTWVWLGGEQVSMRLRVASTASVGKGDQAKTKAS